MTRPYDLDTLNPKKRAFIVRQRERAMACRKRIKDRAAAGDPDAMAALKSTRERDYKGQKARRARARAARSQDADEEALSDYSSGSSYAPSVAGTDGDEDADLTTDTATTKKRTRRRDRAPRAASVPRKRTGSATPIRDDHRAAFGQQRGTPPYPATVSLIPPKATKLEDPETANPRPGISEETRVDTQAPPLAHEDTANASVKVEETADPPTNVIDLCESDDDLPSTMKRETRDSGTMDIVRSTQEERRLKLRRIALEKQKIELDKRRIELESEEVDMEMDELRSNRL